MRTLPILALALIAAPALAQSTVVLPLPGANGYAVIPPRGFSTGPVDAGHPHYGCQNQQIGRRYQYALLANLLSGGVGPWGSVNCRWCGRRLSWDCS
jgi:hypothetical protein